MLEMAMRDYIPAVNKYLGDLSASMNNLIKLMPSVNIDNERAHIERLSKLLSNAYSAQRKLSALEAQAAAIESTEEAAFFYCRDVSWAMEELRSYVDGLEEITSREDWPVPTYGDMTYGEIL